MSGSAPAQALAGYGETGCTQTLVKSGIIVFTPYSKNPVGLENGPRDINGSAPVKRIITFVGPGVRATVKIQHNRIKILQFAVFGISPNELGHITNFHADP
jgi:hypothetical protein